MNSWDIASQGAGWLVVLVLVLFALSAINRFISRVRENYVERRAQRLERARSKPRNLTSTPR